MITPYEGNVSRISVSGSRQGTMQKQVAIILSLLLTLSACATPQVDPTTATYNQTAFTTDLNVCRGGNFIEASAKSIGIAMLGSAYGTLSGIHAGAVHDDTLKGAAIGAAKRA